VVGEVASHLHNLSSGEVCCLNSGLEVLCMSECEYSVCQRLLPHSEVYFTIYYYFIIYFMRKQFYARQVHSNYSTKCKNKSVYFRDEMKKYC
jgi:hypothetical protein